MRKAAWAVGVVALVAVLVIGLSQASDNAPEQEKTAPFDLAAAQQELQGAPAPLAAVHAQANELLKGGVPVFGKRLAELRGYPVVVNKWGSWCGPCRAEFPIFQHASAEYGKRVAFLGLNVGDSEGNASEFLDEYPVTYPSYVDDDKIARSLNAGTSAPRTIFLDRNGKFVRAVAGQYTSEAELRADIKKYLGV